MSYGPGIEFLFYCKGGYEVLIRSCGTAEERFIPDVPGLSKRIQGSRGDKAEVGLRDENIAFGVNPGTGVVTKIS